MSINDIPGRVVLRTKMQWHQEGQRVLSENVANSDTPNFKPRDLVDPKIDLTGASASGGTLPMLRTSAGSNISPRVGGSPGKLTRIPRGRLRDPPGRQLRQSGRRDAEGFRQPDGLC